MTRDLRQRSSSREVVVLYSKGLFQSFKMSYKVETVLKEPVSTIGEGPHWDDATQTLLFVDIMKGDVHRYDPVTGKDDVITLDDVVGFVVPRSKGGLVIALGLAFASLDWETKTVTKLAETDPGTQNHRLNDGKCDPRGRVWGGTMDKEFAPREGGLYCLDTDGTLSKQDENFTISNGMAWSPDNKTMYFNDTTPREIYAYDYDIDTGKISNRRVLVNYRDIPELSGEEVFGPDGMTIDTEGNLWVACFNAGCVAKIDSKTGKLLQKVDIPNATRITSVCWGGKNHDELYVTSLKMQPNTSFTVRDTLDGALFRVTGLGARGAPADIYQG
ncbi:regucalcin-like isoform X2 [Haliotis rubra]|uniref:regucalcin-like isoform X2 n=1 Tax=Haliotis rubra TaxID=36100 RepID=UPI001EE55C3F|nr:regucalcin-like isoform X2 [Haliotis rubra]